MSDKRAMWARVRAAVLLGTTLVTACGHPEKVPPTEASGPASSLEDDRPAMDEGALDAPPEPTPLPKGIAPLIRPFTGDLDAMVERRVVRALVVQNPVFYFVDRGRELGLTCEALKAFEQQLNTRYGQRDRPIYVVAMPVARDELIPRLLAGEGDLILAQMTVTPERAKQVDFSIPAASGISEVLVTGPGTAPVAAIEDLSGREVYVRRSSSYAEHLDALNRRLLREGRAPVKVVAADEILETADILEMVAADLVPATFADSYLATLYAQVFPGLRVQSTITLSTGGEIAWAFRKNSPRLAEAVNAFLRTHKQGTLAGNVLINRYLKTPKWAKNARSEEDIARFRELVGHFRTFAAQYDMDPLLMAAQGYQESGLDQSKRSHVGAIGVMQMMRATARDKAVNIPDIERVSRNIQAGIKYDRWIADTYFNDPGLTSLDRALFALASYNAGANRISRLRREAAAAGLDPDRWFGNVELIVAKRVGREPVQYVSNIYRYYLTYQMVLAQERARREAKGRPATTVPSP